MAWISILELRDKGVLTDEKSSIIFDVDGTLIDEQTKIVPEVHFVH